MIGAIIGDIVGSRFEWNNCRRKDFEMFTPKCFATDDSIMTLAVGKALMCSQPDWSDLPAQAVRCMQEVGRPYPHCGYGGRFREWMYSDDPRPYHSFGNGAAMRVSACGFVARSMEEAKALSRAVTGVTHDHPEGYKGAEAVTVAIYMARTGSALAEIRKRIDREYYPMDFTLDGIRATYRFNETCQHTVPQALMAFLSPRTLRTPSAMPSPLAGTAIRWPRLPAAWRRHTTACPRRFRRRRAAIWMRVLPLYWTHTRHGRGRTRQREIAAS